MMRTRMNGMASVMALAIGTMVVAPRIGAPLRAQRPVVEVRLPAYTQPIQTDTLVRAWEKMEASRPATLAALRAVYDELKLAPDYQDQSGLSLGTLRLKVSRRVGGERLSTYFNCGRSMTGDNAETRRLTIAVVSYLQVASPTSTEVGTGVVGMAQDMSGSSNDLAPCASLGVLEERIASMVRDRLAGTDGANVDGDGEGDGERAGESDRERAAERSTARR